MRTCLDCGVDVPRRGPRGPWPKRCLLCASAHEATRKTEYRKRVGAAGVNTHGYGGYANGCRCEECTTAKREYVRAARAAGKMPDKRRHHDPRVPGYTSRPSKVTG